MHRRFLYMSLSSFNGSSCHTGKDVLKFNFNVLKDCRSKKNLSLREGEPKEVGL